MYFLYPKTSEIRNSADKLGNKIDVRGDGGYVVAPPSMHISGVRYEFANENRIQPLPPEVIQRIGQSRSKSETKEKQSQTQQNESFAAGKRNDSLTRIGGKLRRAGLSQSELETSLLKINAERCEPPLSELEVLQIAQSVARYDVGQKPEIDFESVKIQQIFKVFYLPKPPTSVLKKPNLRQSRKRFSMIFGLKVKSVFCLLIPD